MIHRILLPLTLMIPTIFLYAHGITMSTATVMIRNKTHLTLKVNYDPLLLLNKINADKNKAYSLPVLANMPDSAFEEQYNSIKLLFSKELSIEFDGIAIESMHFRFPPTEVFRKSIREKFMVEEIEYQMKGKNKKTVSHEDQHFYQYFEVDGFLNRASQDGVLYIHFPSKLGEIMVSFSQPKMQTLKPDNSGTHYRQKVELIK